VRHPGRPEVPVPGGSLISYIYVVPPGGGGGSGLDSATLLAE